MSKRRKHHERILVNTGLGYVRQERLNGRVYWISPFVGLVEGVHNGSNGPILYPGHAIAAGVGEYDGMPITYTHPVNEFGTPTSARQPAAMQKYQIGQVFNDSVHDGKRVGEAWFDRDLTAEKAPAIHAVLSKALQGGKTAQLELSTGIRLNTMPVPPGSVWHGPHGPEPYIETVVDAIKPDHLAVFPPGTQIGACSTRDGCGVSLNVMSTSHVGNCGCGRCAARNADGQPCPPCPTATAPAAPPAPARPNTMGRQQGGYVQMADEPDEDRAEACEEVCGDDDYCVTECIRDGEVDNTDETETPIEGTGMAGNPLRVPGTPTPAATNALRPVPYERMFDGNGEATVELVQHCVARANGDPDRAAAYVIEAKAHRGRYQTNALRATPRVQVPRTNFAGVSQGAVNEWLSRAAGQHATANADADDVLPAFSLFPTTNGFDDPRLDRADSSFASVVDGPGGMSQVPGTQAEVARMIKRKMGAGMTKEELYAYLDELGGERGSGINDDRFVDSPEEDFDAVEENLRRLGVRDVGPGSWPSPTLDPNDRANNMAVENSDADDTLPILSAFADRIPV